MEELCFKKNYSSLILKNIANIDNLVIAGASASGKSSAALELAIEIKGSIINCDSIQIYKDIQILSDRPSELNVNNFLYGYLSANEENNLATWEQEAFKARDKSLSLGCIPIFVGGTGMYVDALYKKVAFVPQIPKEILKYSQNAIKDREKFWCDLVKMDPQASSRLNINDTQRILRAYCVYVHTKKSIFDWQSLNNTQPTVLRRKKSLYVIILPKDRDVLYKKAEKRIATMLASGAIEEVERLIQIAKTTPIANSLHKAIGVREIINFLNGSLSFIEMKEAFNISTRQYIKRQYTWFKAQAKKHNCLFLD